MSGSLARPRASASDTEALGIMLLAGYLATVARRSRYAADSIAGS
jgi:hypothetical protein